MIDCTFVILDFEKSLNNVIVDRDAIIEASKTLINKPIVGHYQKVSSPNAEDDNFKGHEMIRDTNKYGEEVLSRDTIPIGVFKSEGYIATIDVDGELKEVLLADAVLWKTKFPDAIDLIMDWYDRGITVNTSCEYLYKNYSYVDGVEYHHSPIIFEAHALLASESRGNLEEVIPAYASSKLLTVNQIEQFKQLVAQAINQEKDKEDEVLAEEIKDQELELNEEEKPTEVVEEEVQDEIIESTEEVVEEEKETQVQLNELSHDDIRSQIREQVKAHISGETWVWVADVFETYTVVEVEFIEEDYTYRHYKYDYSISGETVTVDISTQEEVKAKREWVTVTNELQVELEKVKSEKDDLASKFAEATDTIITLNSQIEQLKPYQELALNAQREQKLAEQIEKYEVKFNAVGASQAFKSDEVQELIMNSIEESEQGKDALLKLNEILFNSIKVEKVESQIQTNVLAGIATKRDNKVDVFVDDFDSKYKY